MEGVNIHYDYIEKRYALGHQLVTSHLMAGRLSVSVRLGLYEHDEGQEGFRSKHAAMEVPKFFIELMMRFTQSVRTFDEIYRYALSDLRELKTP